MKYVIDLPCVACGQYTEGGSILHHLKTRGSGGSDMPFNLIPTCLTCHIEYHGKGLYHMTKKYPGVERWLIENGWEFNDYLKKWTKNE